VRVAMSLSKPTHVNVKVEFDSLNARAGQGELPIARAMGIDD